MRSMGLCWWRLCGVGVLFCAVLAVTSSDDSEGERVSPSVAGEGGERSAAEGLTDNDSDDGPANRYIGYVMGDLKMNEKESIIQEFCSLQELQKVGFKCKKRAKTALVGAFEDPTVSSIESLKDVASKIQSCHSQSGCALEIYPAKAIEMDNDWLKVQLQPHWGLDRLDQKNTPLDHKFRYATTGKGVTIFVMDTGVQKNHDEFKRLAPDEGSRAVHGYSSFANNPLEDSSSDDCIGHGTQVASLAAGTTYGVAKDADVVAVQVLPCKGAASSVDLLIGLQWVLDNVDFFRPAVVLLSLHVRGIDMGVEDVIKKITQAGVLVVTSAGNGGIDACKFSPGRLNETLTVGSSNFWSQLESSSNTGPCVDIYAPGANLIAGSISSEDGYEFVMGTSFAAALAAGVAAQLLERNPQLSPAQIVKVLSERNAVDNKLTHEGHQGHYPLLQVDLSEPGSESRPPVVEPGLAINPRNLEPVNLFKNTQSDHVVVAVQIANYGSKELEWSASNLGANGQDPKWIKMSPPSGSVPSGKRMSVNITYTAQSDAPGFYQGFIEIKSNDPKLEKLQLPVEARIFCSRLFSAGQSYTATLNNTIYYTERPKTWPPAQLPDVEGTLFIESVFILSQPIIRLDEVDLQVTGGLIETFTPVDDELCSMYHVRAIKEKEDVWNGSNNFCIRIWENTIFSIAGKTFSNQTICTDYDDKPESRIYATHMSYDPEKGLVTDSSNPVMLIAFSEEVQGFEDSKVQVSPGALESLKPVPGATSMYYAHIRLPEGFIGKSTIHINVDEISDLAGNAVADAPSLSFHRVNTIQVEHTSFELKDEL